MHFPDTKYVSVKHSLGIHQVLGSDRFSSTTFFSPYFFGLNYFIWARLAYRLFVMFAALVFSRFSPVFYHDFKTEIGQGRPPAPGPPGVYTPLISLWLLFFIFMIVIDIVYLVIYIIPALILIYCMMNIGPTLNCDRRNRCCWSVIREIYYCESLPHQSAWVIAEIGGLGELFSLFILGYVFVYRGWIPGPNIPGTDRYFVTGGNFQS